MAVCCVCIWAPGNIYLWKKVALAMNGKVLQAISGVTVWGRVFGGSLLGIGVLGVGRTGGLSIRRSECLSTLDRHHLGHIFSWDWFGSGFGLMLCIGQLSMLYLGQDP